MAKMFNQRPSDVALLDDCVSRVGRFYFDRDIADFGSGVHARMQQVGQSSNPAIARMQKEREWERLMGGDMSTSTTGFQDPSPDSISAHGKAIGAPEDDDEEDIVLDD